MFYCLLILLFSLPVLNFFTIVTLNLFIEIYILKNQNTCNTTNVFSSSSHILYLQAQPRISIYQTTVITPHRYHQEFKSVDVHFEMLTEEICRPIYFSIQCHYQQQQQQQCYVQNLPISVTSTPINSQLHTLNKHNIILFFIQ